LIQLIADEDQHDEQCDETARPCASRSFPPARTAAPAMISMNGGEDTEVGSVSSPIRCLLDPVEGLAACVIAQPLLPGSGKDVVADDETE
jgi:hypothetical protein